MTQFTYFSNRGSRIFRSALEPMGGREFRKGDCSVDILYFDTYGGKRFDSGVAAERRLIDRKRTIPLDHKLHLARRMKDHGIDYPRVYFSPDEVPEENEKHWYVKDPLSTGGKGIQLCHYGDIQDSFREGFLIQEAVQDPLLIDGRKFTVRSYVLVHNGIVYLHPDSILILHGKKYDPINLDPHSHYVHDGYMSADSTVRMTPSTEYARFNSLIDRLANVVAKIFPLYSEELMGVGEKQYCIFGLDSVPTQNGQIALIEINDRPNIVHTALINEQVNTRIIEAMAKILLAGQLTGNTAREFMEIVDLRRAQ